MAKNRNRYGYILTELIMTIFIVLLLIPSIQISIYCLNKSLDFDSEVQDELAIQQLRRVLTLSYDVEIIDNSLNFKYQGEERNLLFKNNKLIISPGTWIFLTELDGGSIYENNEIIYLTYEKNNETVTSPLKKK